MNRRNCVLALAALPTLPTHAALAKASMNHRPINTTEASYAHAHEVTHASRLLFISGQVPEGENGEVPADFANQCRLAWANVEQQLHGAGMSFDNLVKLTTFLSDRRYRRENSEVHKAVLGDRKPALTIIITGIYDESWLLEIEAVAAA